jgi:hypothetical protein
MHMRLAGIKRDGALLSEAKAYLRAGPSSLVGQVVMQTLASGGIFARVDGLSNWLLELPPDLGAIGDLPLLTRLAVTNPRQGIEYLQKLLDQTASLTYDRRAGAALDGFAKEFSRAHPAEAFPWALNLPEDLGGTRSSVLVTVYSSLYRTDPALADEYAESVTDNQALKDIRTLQDMAARELRSPAAKKTRTGGKVARSEPEKRREQTPHGVAPVGTGH